MEQCVALEFERPPGRAWVRVGAAAVKATVRVNGHVVGSHVGPWDPFQFEITSWLGEHNRLEVHCEECDHPTLGFLPSIGMNWCGARDVEILDRPVEPRPAVAQRSKVHGRQLRVDGAPFRVRGILHWGYYPELGTPWPQEDQMRREILELQAMGFNLIKFCLWIPAPRYYELCDELGMLVWQEYPLWNRPLRDRSLIREYESFFCLDRGYSCVILRSLTCENDHVDAPIAAEIIARARELIPGVVILDNSGWLCSEHNGDFHDEHIYLSNVQMPFYKRRMTGRLKRPLLLGETMCVDSIDPPSHRAALETRRFQIETFTRDFPDAGYVITGLRDLKKTPLGLYTRDGAPKYSAEEWSWHGADGEPSRRVPPLSDVVIGPRKGEWKCPEHTWWSPIIKVLDANLPEHLIQSQAPFQLLSGRVLACCHGARMLVELWDVHSGKTVRHPLVIEFTSEGRRQVVSAFRHDTEPGRALLEVFDARTGSAPEIGPLHGSSIVLEDWEMSRDGESWSAVKCDTPLVNEGRNVFEGWATFRAVFDYPGGGRTLRCEAVGDYYQVSIDDVVIGEAGNRDGTWDGTRDIPREFLVQLAPGTHEIVFRVRDWRAAGGMVGPVYLAEDVNERVF